MLGAHAARGDILWFVHVDAELPLQCLDEIARIMEDTNVVGGYFRIRLPTRPGLSVNGQFRALCRHAAPNAMRRSWNLLSPNCIC